MDAANVWWILAGLAVGVELLTGTFYLLMLALGLAAGAVAAALQASPSAQLLVAALVGGGAVAAWHLIRQRRPALPSADNPAVHLDVGETVHVDAWHVDQTAQVRYRGAAWTAVRAPGSAEGAGPHRVRGLTGNHLILEKI